MELTYSAHALLKETYELLSVPGSGSSDEANRKIALCEKIRRHLLSEGSPVMGGGGGGPGIYAAPGSVSTGSIAVKPGDVATIIIGEGGGASLSIVDLRKKWHEEAMRLGKPVCTGAGGGGGMKGFGDWVFPDGHTERLPADETPKWPKDDPTRDAVRANQ